MRIVLQLNLLTWGSFILSENSVYPAPSRILAKAALRCFCSVLLKRRMIGHIKEPESI